MFVCLYDYAKPIERFSQYKGCNRMQTHIMKKCSLPICRRQSASTVAAFFYEPVHGGRLSADIVSVSADKSDRRRSCTPLFSLAADRKMARLKKSKMGFADARETTIAAAVCIPSGEVWLFHSIPPQSHRHCGDLIPAGVECGRQSSASASDVSCIRLQQQSLRSRSSPTAAAATGN